MTNAFNTTRLYAENQDLKERIAEIERLVENGYCIGSEG